MGKARPRWDSSRSSCGHPNVANRMIEVRATCQEGRLSPPRNESSTALLDCRAIRRIRVVSGSSQKTPWFKRYLQNSCASFPGKAKIGGKTEFL